MYDAFDDYDDYEEEYIDVDADIDSVMSSVEIPVLSEKINTSEIISEGVISSSVLSEKVTTPKNNEDNLEHLGDYNTKMPKIPEDIDTFDMLADEVPGEYESKTLLVTKRFKEFRYPQLRVSEDVLQHKYMVTSLKSLISTKQLDYGNDELCFDVIIPFKDGEVVRLGIMLGRNLNNFLSTSVFKEIDKCVYLNEDTEIKGDMMYALCTSVGED